MSQLANPLGVYVDTYLHNVPFYHTQRKSGQRSLLVHCWTSASLRGEQMKRMGSYTGYIPDLILISVQRVEKLFRVLVL
jgi:hypothetical protein